MVRASESLEVALQTRGLHALGWTTPPAFDPELCELARVAAHACNAALGVVSIFVADRPLVVAVSDPTAIPATSGQRTLCEIAARRTRGGTVVIPDLRADPELADHPMTRSGVRFYASEPLLGREGDVLGTLCVMDLSPGELDEDHARFLATLGRQVATSLEMRRQTTELEATRTQLADAADVADVVMWHRAPSGGPVTWIGNIERLLGFGPGEFDGRTETLLGCIHPDDRERALAERDALFGTGGTADREFRIVRPDGSIRYLQGRYRVESIDGRPGAGYGTLIDVTEVRQRELTLSQVLARMEDIVVGFDRSLRMTYLNPRAGRDAGRSIESLIGHSLDEIFPVGPDHPMIVALRRSITDGVPREIESYFAPVERWYRSRIHPSSDGATVFASDITEARVAAERESATLDKLRALTARIQRVREDESQRIARELHDEFGQGLTALQLDVRWLRPRLAPSPELAHRLDEMTAQLDHLGKLVRRVATELRPQLLDDLGLHAAIEWQVGEFSRRTGLSCSTSLPEKPPDLGKDAIAALFRVLQELLTNVARHAEARAVTVSLASDDDATTLIVRDDGRGMPAEIPPTSLGVLGMRERMLSVGGELVTESRRGEGTTVRAKVPRRRS